MLRTAKLKLLPIARYVAAAIALCVSASAAHASDGRLIVSGAAVSAAGRLQPLGPPTIPQSMSGAAASAGGAVWNAARSAVELPRGNPLADPLDIRSGEAELFADGRDGGLRRISLVDAALVACGVDNFATIENARGRIAAARNELKQLMTTRASAFNNREEVTGLQRVELVHRVLHQRLLTGGYNANATNLATTLNTGVYNCASATLLFVALTADLGINVQAIELPGHVRAMVDCEDQRYEVEVTCPVWREAILRVGDAAGRVSRENAMSGAAGQSERPISTLGRLP